LPAISPDYSANGADLAAAAAADVDAGLTPVAVIATLGTTSLGTHDHLQVKMTNLYYIN